MIIDNNKPRTLFHFIPINKMIAYKKAEKESNMDDMKRLRSEIDILDIETAIHLSY
jgi:hypothetical protein